MSRTTNTAGRSPTPTRAINGTTTRQTRGTVKITVIYDDSVADTISYSVDADDTLTFDGGDFSDVCYDATDEDLDYVKFTSLPSSYYGVLYTDDDCDTKVTKSTAYDEGDLSDMTFVPNDDYSGTVTYSYTGYTDDDTTYTGTVKSGQR